MQEKNMSKITMQIFSIRKVT